jgi:hypothetical protein
VVILEAQMAAGTAFLRRLYLESAMLLDQEPGVAHWRVGVICPHRRLNFGRELAVVEFVRERVHWIELEAAAADPDAPPLLRALALLVEPEEQVPKRSAAIRRQSAGTPDAAGLADVIAAIVITRFNGRSLGGRRGTPGTDSARPRRRSGLTELAGPRLREHGLRR